jgi:Uma2 family endonuclease
MRADGNRLFAELRLGRIWMEDRHMSSNLTNLPGFSPGDLPSPPNQRMEKEAFFHWALATGMRAEWVNGEVIQMAAANRDHMECRRWFDDVLTLFVRRHKLGRVGDDMFVDLDGQRTLRVPDTFFVRRDREQIIRQTVLTAPPDLALEVISPDSRTRDRDDKLAEYEAFGIAEYWIIDPMNEQVEVHVLNADKKYELLAPREGELHSTVVPGFWIRPEWLWRETRIDEDEAYQLMTANQ